MRWGEKDTHAFVKIYLAQECLWNPKDFYFRSKPDRHTARKQIISQFSLQTGILLTEDEVKAKIRSLCSTYCQEKKKIESRSRPDYEFRPKIKWFYDFHKCFSKRNLQSQSKLDGAEHSDDSNSKSWGENDQSDDQRNLSSQSDEYLCILKPEPEQEAIIANEDNTVYRSKRRKYEHRSNEENNNSRNRKDEFDVYGEYVAAQLRTMELKKALRLQLEIQEMISESRLSDLNQ
ncbi:unnamed protein product [Leptidea sinapis]|uniref:MADF domain-containing protein n=1 Tax=Leptidea sinapis TaxID=189913 RepID=A0A5E4R364_9NEOP|nr:unnamed protein product [Leptidea sinapis]